MSQMFSVIIPVYNVAPYLEKCIQSVLKQSYQDLEILLIDDGSTDNSGAICDKYEKADARVRVFHKENGGVSRARNYGIEQARGEWIFFIDSDDWIDAELIQYAADHLNGEDDICFVGNCVVNEEKEQKTVKNELKVLTIAKKDFSDLQKRIFNRDRVAVCDRNLIKLSSPCKIYRKKMLDKYNIRFPEDVPNGEDGVFNLYAYRYARKGIALENPLYYYRQRSDSVTNKYTPDVEQDFALLHEQYRKFVQSQDDGNITQEIMDERYIWSLSFCCILKYCHPDNKMSYKQRKEEFIRARMLYYKNSVERVSLESFGVRKKLMFKAIQLKCFWLINIFCKLNEKR